MSKAIDEMRAYFNQMPVPPKGALLEARKKVNRWIDEVEAENANLQEDLEFERSENGWAREFLDRMAKHCGTKDCPSLVAYVTKLENENAKMRELLRGLYSFAFQEYPDGVERNFADELRKLGIEVETDE